MNGGNGNARRRREIPRVPAVIALAIAAIALVGFVSMLVIPRLEQREPQPRFVPAPPPPGIPNRGEVGYRGRMEDLRVITGSAGLPDGASWNSSLRAVQVEVDDLVLEGLYVRGGIDFRGRGTLTIRHSVVEGGWGNGSFVVIGRNDGAVLHVEDSTLRWRDGAAPRVGNGAGAIQVLGQVRVIAVRNDISGTADGIQLAADESRVEQNWIHDLARVGEHPDALHNDGVQVFHGTNVLIQRNRIELGFDGVHQNAAVFMQPSAGAVITAPQVVGNYLQGGGYVLRLEGPQTRGAIVVDNHFGPLEGGAFGLAYALEGATVERWTGNTRADGTVVEPPSRVDGVSR